MSDVLTDAEVARLPKYLKPLSGQATPEMLKDMNPAELERHQKRARDISEHMSPSGALGLPPLLEHRRQDFGLPDELFGQQASFGYVLVYQLSQVQGQRYGDTQIFMPEVTRIREEREAPRGIIVSAGLKALDELRSNGIDLGHIVAFNRNIPYRLRVTTIGAMDWVLILLQSGDIVSSEDLARERILGKVSTDISTDERTQFDYHWLKDESSGHLWKPHAAKRKI